MNLFIVLVLSIISIFFLLFGTLIVFSTKDSKKLMTFSVSLGFVVLILLGGMHLIPDAYEFFNEEVDNVFSVLLILLFAFLGFITIFILDKVGGHHHEHSEDHNKGHFEHISIITCIFLVIHNFIEGMTIYSSVLLNYETAVILTLGIGLHNVPLGFTLSSTFNKIFSKSKTVLYIILIGLSYLFGAIIAYKFNEALMNSIVLGGALTITFGMVLYIAVFEFLPMLKESSEIKIRNIGFLTGIVLMLLSLFL